MATLNDLSIKLVIDSITDRVLFAEADKQFVDLLFSLLALPLGSIIKIVTKEVIAGCIGNVHESVERFSSSYIQPNQNMNYLKKPIGFAAGNIALLPPSLSEVNATYYKCSKYHNFVTDAGFPNVAACPGCGSFMSHQTTLVGATNEVGGYVKGAASYMVTDDLNVMPLTSVTLLKKFGDENLTCLEERVVSLTTDQVLELLKTSLNSENALSKVFLEKKVKLNLAD